MRDKRFIAQHRGGPLKKDHHYQLIQWACDCSQHVMPLFGEKIDDRLINALEVAREWKLGKKSVGEARKASVEAHAVARVIFQYHGHYGGPFVGHAVATAHMADHSLGAAWYALKAVKSVGGSIEMEKKWQDQQLPSEIRELVLTARKADKFKNI